MRKKQEKKLVAKGKTPEEAAKIIDKKDGEDSDEYVSVEGAEVDEGVQPGTVKKDENNSRAFQNF